MSRFPGVATSNENQFRSHCTYTVGVQPAVSTSELEVRYDDKVAITDVSLQLPEASSLAVIGPNGSGKSTLLHAIAGLVEPSAGTVRRNAGSPALVLQATEVDRGLPITVRDTVSLARYPSVGLFGRFRAADRAAVAEAMARLDITDLSRRQLHELSGGQRQRVLVAQGLAQDTNVLLLDEPVNGLDVTSRAVILEVIDAEVASGRAVVVTTHNLDDARRCDQVLLLDTAPIALGAPDEVLTEHHLRAAFGGRFVRAAAELLLDDPHHHDE